MSEIYLGHHTYFYEHLNKVVVKIGDNIDEVLLDNLESSVLSFFIKNPNKDIYKTELMDLWQAQYVMEHSLTRVISTLRKKLGDTTKPVKFIKTVPRIGYRFIGEGVEYSLPPSSFSEKEELPIFDSDTKNVETKQPLTDTSPGLKNSLPKHNYIWYLFVVTAFLAVVFIYLTQKDDIVQVKFSQSPVVELINDDVHKKQYSVDPTGNVIAYAAFTSLNHSHLKFKKLDSEQITQYQKGESSYWSPTWINEHQLAVIEYGSGNCAIKKLTLSKDYEVTKDQFVISCNTLTASKGLVALNDHTLIMSDTSTISEPMQMFSINIESGAKKLIGPTFSDGHGVYRIYISPNKDYLVTLSTKDWISTDIHVFQTKNLEKHVWHNNVNLPIFSVALDDNKIIHKTDKGSLSVVFFKNNKSDAYPIPILLTRPIYSPTYFPGGFIFSEGFYYAQKVVINNLGTETKTPLFSLTGTKIQKPELVKNSGVIYNSNKNGISQVWYYDLDKKTHTQISRFDSRHLIEGKVFDDTSNRLAISTNFGIYLSHFDKTGNPIDSILIDGQIPQFWKGKLLFNRQKSGNAVYVLNDKTNEAEPLIEHGAYHVSSDGEDLYYSKYYQPGIWRFNESGEDYLVYRKIESVKQQKWMVKDGTLFISYPNSEDIIKVDLTTKETTTFSKAGCVDLALVSKGKCISVVREIVPNRLLRYQFNE